MNAFENRAQLSDELTAFLPQVLHPQRRPQFRQGVGRLIRTKSDTGIIVVLDNRVLTKKYGQMFLNSVPTCPVQIV